MADLVLRHRNQDSLHLGTSLFGGSPLARRYLSLNILPALHANLVWQRLPGICWQGSVLVAVVTQEQCGMQRALQNTAPPNDAL